MIERLGVVGAGQMGAGIAQVALAAGYAVTLTDARPEALEAARAGIAKGLGRQVEKGALAPGARDAALGRLALAPDLAGLAAMDLVVEAATEAEEVKAAIFRGLAPHLAAQAILATNTSSIPITRLAAQSDRPDRFVGLHFMNPVPVMPLVELIRGLATSDDTVAEARAVAERLGKTVVESRDAPGFLVNRLLIPMVNEAASLLEQGVGTAEGIDAALRLGANHPMGPLALADLIGLDTVLAIMEVLQRETGDPKYRPCPLIRRHVEAGWTGRKAGRGFHLYGR